MDPVRATAMLKEARVELAAARSSVSYLSQVVAGLEGVMRLAPGGGVAVVDSPHSGVVQQDDPPAVEPAAPEKAYPKSPIAIEMILSARPNQPMRFPDVWKLIVAEKLNDPAIKSGINAYQNSARRLSDNPTSPVKRTADGSYVYRTDSPAPPSEATLDLGSTAAAEVSAP